MIPDQQEADMWRMWYLNYMFENFNYKFIPDEDKVRLASYWTAIPFGNLTNPEKSWHECVSTLLQYKNK